MTLLYDWSYVCGYCNRVWHRCFETQETAEKHGKAHRQWCYMKQLQEALDDDKRRG
jgi:hypothetical protein